MEAVAAVGVAAAAVQFFEVAAKALKTCSEIRQSARGESKSNEDLGKYVQELQRIRSSLKAPLFGNDSQTNVVEDIRQECGEIAKEILLRLEKAQQHGRKGWRKSMQATFRAMADSKNMKDLERRYELSQRKFQEALSVDMRNAIASVLQEQGKTSDTLLNIVLPKMHTRFDQVQTSLGHQAFLGSLFFPDMFARHRNIERPSEGTYEWIFDQDTAQDEEMRAKLGKFKHWMSNDEPYFWINGKAGSGKSSLMSFIESDKRTKDALRVWAGSRELYIFSFFFWRPGSDLQKSITGLLQSLLYQLVKSKPAAMSGVVSPGQTSIHSVWTETTLLRTIVHALSLYGQDRLFILIDGLDEFEGQYMRLLDTLFKLKSGSNIKFCFSSRPEAALVKRLASFPSIRLQDVNFRDIDTFVKQTLEPYKGLDTTNDDIALTVGSQSEGIFLWAVLVCRSLVSGYEAGDDKDTIQRRLDAIPKGLEPLFSHMFSSIEDVHRDSLSVYFSLLKWGVNYVALATMLLHGKPFETLQRYADECRLMKHRIVSQSKGLIEINDHDWQRDRPNDFRWALVHPSTGQSRTDFVHASECLDLAQHHSIMLQWVHRSAYDCIMNSPSHGLVISLQPENELDLARRTLVAILWLSKHVPHIVLTPQPNFSTRTSGFIDAMGRLSKIPGIDLNHEVDQALDDLFNALLSSLYTDDGVSLRPALSKRLEHSTNVKHDTSKPLLDFWAGVARFPDLDRYILPRFERLEHNACALEPLGHILYKIAHKAWQELPVVFHKTVKALTATRHTQERPQAAFAMGSSGLLTNHTGKVFHHIMSFSGDDAGEEHMYMTTSIFLAIFDASLQARGDSRDLWQDFISQLFKVSEAWNIHLGSATECEPGLLSPLQMQIPQTYFHIHKFSLPTSLALAWPKRTLRLLCLEPKQLKTGPIVRTVPFKVTASFDISEQCLHAIGDLVIDDLSPFGGFTESMGQERCLHLILEDVWEDPDRQLDAWERLYVRAYVRKWFKYLWVRETEE